MSKIDLKQAIEILKSGRWISNLKCFTANVNKKEAGKIIILKQCRIAREKTLIRRNAPTTSSSGLKKSANHNENFTINVELKNKQLRKIHPLLIFELNNMQVI